MVKGKCCMFIFLLKVLDGNRSGSSGPGSYFSLEKASLTWHCKKGPKPSALHMFKPCYGPPIPPSQPLISDLTDVHAKKAKVHEALILATLSPLVVGPTEAPMALNPLDSPLPMLMPSSLGPGSPFTLPLYDNS